MTDGVARHRLGVLAMKRIGLRKIGPLGLFFLLAASSCGGGEDGTASGFEEYGVIESLYGTSWSHQDRIDILNFMGEEGMTAYFYAPRDDPFQRERWPHPYTGRSLREFQEVLSVASANRIRFTFALRPGNSIDYSSEEDLRALLNKLESMRALGVEDFALFFDDTPLRLSVVLDRSEFVTLAESQAALINRTYDFLRERGCSLAVCPASCLGDNAGETYLKLLGSQVHSDVAFFWSGSDVVPPEFTSDGARAWGKLLGRSPVIWDRYPANDFADWRLFLGPVSGLGQDLSDVSRTILSTPMKQAHASMIALATFADYARDPAGYEPEEAQRRAVSRLYDRDTVRLIRPFLEIYGGAPGTDHLFDPLFIPQDTFSIPAVEEGLGRLEGALRNLKSEEYSSDIELKKLVRELEPTVIRTRQRYNTLLADNRFEKRDNQLAYRTEIDRYEPRLTTREITLDGQTDDWQKRDWISLSSGGGESFDYGVDVALCQTGADIYLAIRVLDRTPVRLAGEKVGEGDHLAILVADPSRPNAFESHLIPPDSSSVPIVSRRLPRSGFVGQALKGSSDLLFDSFLLSLLEELPSDEKFEAVSVRSTAGYVVEARLTKQQASETRFNLVAVDIHGQGRRFFSLAKRNYPANTSTYASIHHE